MATFNPSNGCIMGSTQGTVCPLDPNYTDALGQAQQSGNLQSVGTIVLDGTIHEPAVAVSSKLPSAQHWTLPGARAVVYTDASGNSSFSYKDDPQGMIQLIPGGSQAMPPTQIQSTATSSSSSQGSSIIGFICWCLSSMSSIFIIIGCFVVIVALFKKN
jgi:hypothetical protein